MNRVVFFKKKSERGNVKRQRREWKKEGRNERLFNKVYQHGLELKS